MAGGEDDGGIVGKADVLGPEFLGGQRFDQEERTKVEFGAEPALQRLVGREIGRHLLGYQDLHSVLAVQKNIWAHTIRAAGINSSAQRYKKVENTLQKEPKNCPERMKASSHTTAVSQSRSLRMNSSRP